MDEKLRFVIDLQNRASAELQKLSKEMGGIKPGAGAKATASWFQTLETASSAATKSLRPMSGALNTVGVSSLAAGLSVTGLIAQFRDLARQAPALQELSRQTGMTRTQIERLKYAAKDLSIDPGKMEASLQHFSGMMVQFHNETGEVYTEMQNGAAGLAQKIKDEGPEEAYKDILKWLAAIPEAAQKAGKSQADAVQAQRYWTEKALGDADMSQIVGRGMAGFDHAMENARKNVGEITDALIAEANKLNESINAFDQSWHTFETTVGPTVFKNLTKATDDFREVFKEVEDAVAWFDRHKEHPLQDAGNAAMSAIDAQAKHNAEHPEGIILDLPGLVSKGIHALTDAPQAPAAPLPDSGSRPITLRAPAPVPATLRPAPFHPDDDRATRARASDAPDRSLDGFVLGSLDKPVTHLVGTLKTAAAALDGNVRPAAFHPAGMSGSAAGLDPVEAIAAGTRRGFVEAFREIQGMTDLDGKGAGGGGGFTPAAFHPSAGGGFGGTSASAAGRPNMRYGRGGRTPAGSNGLDRFDGNAPGANGYGLINAPYTAPLDAKGEGGQLSPHELFDYLKAHGATGNEATMLTGAAGSESSFNARAVHDGGNGYGLWGHNIHDRMDLRGLSWQQQADRALDEVKRDYAGRVNAARTPEELADAEMHYERPRGYHSNNPRGGDNYTGRLNTLRRFSHGFGTMGFDPAKPEAPTPDEAGSDGIRGHIRGSLKIGDETYAYGSGGVRGSAHVPYGDYPINPDSRNPWGQAHNAMDVNSNGSIWDASLGRMRTGIEMHVAHSANMVTEGCLSFLKEQYPQLKSRVKDMIAKTGRAYLHIDEKGASITSSPKADHDDLRTKIAPMPAITPEPPRQPVDNGSGQRAEIDPVRIDLHHHEGGRTKIAAKTGRGVQLSIRTAPTMVQTV